MMLCLLFLQDVEMKSTYDHKKVEEIITLHIYSKKWFVISVTNHYLLKVYAKPSSKFNDV